MVLRFANGLKKIQKSIHGNGQEAGRNPTLPAGKNPPYDEASPDCMGIFTPSRWANETASLYPAST